jgi:hypothetical protein
MRVPGAKEWPKKKALLYNKIAKVSLLSAGEGCDGGINAMVEGSKFKESHVLKILS